MPTQIDSLEVKVQAQATSAITSLNNLEKKLLAVSKTLSGVNGTGLQEMSKGIITLGYAVKQIRTIDSRSFSTLATNINKLGSVDSIKLRQTANSLRSMTSAIQTLGSASASATSLSKISSLFNSMKRVSTIDASKFSTSLPAMGKAIRDLTVSLQNVPTINKDVIQLTNALAKLGRVDISKFSASAPLLSKSITDLIVSLNQAPKVRADVLQLTNALSKLNGRAIKLGSASASTNSFFRNLTNGANRSAKSVKSLAYYFGKFYASYFLFIRAFSKIKDMIDLSSSTTELGNVVAVTFGQYQDKLKQFSSNSIEKYGMSQLTAMKVSSRFQAMGTAMGFSADKMSDMSIRLTELTSDMASFYDVSQEDVAEDLASIFTGMTRPLRTYGLDLTEATLKEWAMKNGLDANIKSMTQAEKTMLRYQYVLANTTQVNGDFERTMYSWHNQVTILKANLQQLGTTWGNAFVAMLKPALIYLNKALVVFNRFSEGVVNALGQIFGWKMEVTSGSIVDDLEEADNTLQDATSDAKKLKQQLQGIDELNVLNVNDSSDGGTSSASGTGTYQKAQYNVEQQESYYKSSIKDLESLGESITESLKNAMDNIDWNAIYQKASNFGSGLASFLNGMLKQDSNGGTLFGSLGKTLANGLNSIVYAVFSFSEEFEWADFGYALKDGIQSFIDNVDLATAGYTVGNLVKGIANSIYVAVSDMNTWKSLGQKIADGINGFLESMDKVDEKTGLNGWQALGKSISSTLSGFATTMITALEKVDWDSVGKAIGDLISSIDWGKVAFSLSGLADAVIKSIRKVIKNIKWSDVLKGVSNFLGNLNIKDIAIIIGAINIKKILGKVFTKKLFLSEISSILGISGGTLALGILAFSLTLGTLLWLNENEIPKKIIDGIKQWKLPNGTSTNWDGHKVKLEIPLEIKFKTIISDIADFISEHNPLSFLENYFQKQADDNFQAGLETDKKWNEIKAQNASNSSTTIDVHANITSAGVSKDLITPSIDSKANLTTYKDTIESNSKKLVDFEAVTSTWRDAVEGKKEMNGFTSLLTSYSDKIDDKKQINNVNGIINTYSDGINEKKSLLNFNSLISDYSDNITKRKTIGNMTGNITSYKDKITSSKTIKNFSAIVNKFQLKGITSLQVTDENGSIHTIYKSDGGVYSNGHWKTIDQYASGGIPSHGTHFIAGENGAEVVGNINGRTEVLNQSQMASVMYNAVVNGINDVLGNFRSGDTVVQIDGKEIARATKNIADTYTRRTGNPYFAY